MNFDKPEGFNALATELLRPFPLEDQSTRNDLTYVDPARYKARLLEAFPEGFLFQETNVKYIEELKGLQGDFHFVGSEGGVTYDIAVVVFKELQIGRESGEAQKLGEIYNQLTSRGLKAICDKMGLGLHLYYHAPKNGQSNGQTNGDTKTYSEWDGSVTLKSGKNKGKKWSELELETVEYLAGMDKPNELAIKELNRRKGGSQTAAPAEIGSDEEVPF